MLYIYLYVLYIFGWLYEREREGVKESPEAWRWGRVRRRRSNWGAHCQKSHQQTAATTSGTAGAISSSTTAPTVRNLGNSYTNGTGGNGYSKIYLDDFRIYNRILSATEISVLYNTGGYSTYSFLNDTTNLIAWYKFDIIAPNIDNDDLVIDSSGNNRTLTRYNATINTTDDMIRLTVLSDKGIVDSNRQTIITIDINDPSAITTELVQI